MIVAVRANLPMLHLRPKETRGNTPTAPQTSCWPTFLYPELGLSLQHPRIGTCDLIGVKGHIGNDTWYPIGMVVQLGFVLFRVHSTYY